MAELADALDSGTVELSYRVPLGAGDNRLEAYAFNSANIRSLTAHGLAHGPATASRRTAWLLAIGVNQYADSSRDLEYARADAEEFLHQVHAHLKGLDQFDGIEEKLLPDNDATHNNIQAALADIARKAGPDDAVLIFYAGHGMARNGKFYLLPHDADFSAPGQAPYGKAPPPRALSDDDLSNLLEPVNAGHIVLILDTCQSATTLENAEWRRGPLNSRGLAQLAYEKGIYLLAAAQNDGVAKERREFGHGLLTYALMNEALNPDFSDVAPHDGVVTVNEWLNYAGHRVPELDAENQLPSRGVKSPRPRPQPVQQPRVYYRREWQTPALIVAGHAGQQ